MQIIGSEAPIETILLAAGLPGVYPRFSPQSRPRLGAGRFLRRRAGLGLPGGRYQSLDFLQPGRHTFAFYSGLSIAGGRGARRGVQAASDVRPAAIISIDGSLPEPLLIGIRILGPSLGIPSVPHLEAGEPVPVEPAPRRACLGRRSRPAPRQARRAAAL